MSVENKVFIVTGGCSGLGKATAEHLGSFPGVKVAVFDLDVSEEVKVASDRLLKLKTDVTDGALVRQNVDEVVKKFGKIDAVINCAGIATAGLLIYPKNPKHEMNAEKMELTFKVNVMGTFNVMKAYLEQYNKNQWKKGCIVNVASVAAEDGQNGQVAYSVSKGAITGMTLPAARELGAHGVRIVAVMPGIFDTNMSSMMPDKVMNNLLGSCSLGRFGLPQEFAMFVEAVLKNEYLTGVNLRIDGGNRLTKL